MNTNKKPSCPLHTMLTEKATPLELCESLQKVCNHYLATAYQSGICASELIHAERLQELFTVFYKLHIKEHGNP